jgi:hypothetical protein
MKSVAPKVCSNRCALSSSMLALVQEVTILVTRVALLKRLLAVDIAKHLSSCLHLYLKFTEMFRKP